jgi:hypothetical protein
MNKTENLNLPQWEATDMVQRADFNDAFSKLDTGYAAALETAENALAAVSGVADAGALESLQAALESKAEQADLAALTETVAGKAALDDLTALKETYTSEIAKRGNCQVLTGTYTGNGKYGSSNPTSILFSSTPVLLFVSNHTMARCQSVSTANGYSVTVTWNGKNVSWYSDSSAEIQMNSSGTKYSYVAFCTL